MDDYLAVRSEVLRRVPELKGSGFSFNMERDVCDDITLVSVTWAWSAKGTAWHQIVSRVPRGNNPLTEATITDETINVLRVKVKMSKCL